MLDISIEALLGALSVMVVWFTYRSQRLEERNRILTSLKSMMGYSSGWFSTSYDENSNDFNWYDPTKSVYPVDISQLPSILTSNLLSEELVKRLSYFIQLVRRFNHRIDIFNNYIYSDLALFKKSEDFLKRIDKTPARTSYIELKNLIDKEKDSDLRSYFNHVYFLQKLIHTDGIGNQSFYDNDFPKLNLCFTKINDLLKKEGKTMVGLFRGNWSLIFVDVVLICFPLLVVTLFLLQFLKNHIIFIVY